MPGAGDQRHQIMKPDVVIVRCATSDNDFGSLHLLGMRSSLSPVYRNAN